MEVTRDGGRRVENFADPTDKLAQSPSFGGKPFITAMIRVMKIHSGTPIMYSLFNTKGHRHALALGVGVPGHCQEKLMQTSIVCCAC